MTETDAPKAKPKPTLRSEIRFLLILALIVLGFQSLIAKPFYIPSESMLPGLKIGDNLIVSKYAYGWSYVSPSFHLLPFMHGRLFGKLPERGDVVILTPPGANRRNQDWIKRVIGLPGDTVQMVQGRLWLNGRPVKAQDLGIKLEPIDGNFDCSGAGTPTPDGKFCRIHVIRETLPNGATYTTVDRGPSPVDDTAPYVVPADGIFVMGDNRDNSADSRVPIAQDGLGGAIPFENIGGRAEFITFSLNGNAGWNPLSWFSAFRSGRMGHSLRPEHVKP